MQRLEYVTLSSQMFDFLRREIIVSDQFKEGVFIREGEIADRLGVSRAPVREAIKQMEMMGLVVSIPRRGVQVRFFSPEELNELYEMREVLESCVFRTIVEKGLFTQGQYRRFEEILEALLSICESDLERDEKIAAFCDKDMEFHMSLAELSRRRWTAHALEMLYFQLHQALLSDVDKTEVLTDLVRLHYSILDNLLAGDLEGLAVDRRYSYFNRRNNPLEM